MEISAEELKVILKEKSSQYIVLDVREDWEFEEFSITEYNIPLYNIPQRISEFEKWKNEKVIVFCRSGKRGNQAQKFLNQKGYKNIYNLAGGIEAYLMAVQK